jgi:hypothetical protein
MRCVENAEVHNCKPGGTPRIIIIIIIIIIVYETASLTYRRMKMVVVVRRMMTSVCALETRRGEFDQNSRKHC